MTQWLNILTIWLNYLPLRMSWLTPTLSIVDTQSTRYMTLLDIEYSLIVDMQADNCDIDVSLYYSITLLKKSAHLDLFNARL